MSLPKLLSIVGPTACGKTDFALETARSLIDAGLVIGVDIIAADSRQVYQGLEIMSGADVPPDFRLKKMASWPELAEYFEFKQMRIFGISILKPTALWSVSQFQDYALQVCQLSWDEGRLPVIVGGTGLYHAHVLNSDTQLHTQPDPVLRQSLEEKSVLELQTMLQQLDSVALSSMNNSDRHNPRRLVRAIEKAGTPKTAPEKKPAVSELMIGLTDSIEAIEERIAHRVHQRLTTGAVQEVEQLLATTEDMKLPVWSTTGAKVVLAYSTGEIDHGVCEELWSRQERQYAKRQLTWWKKRPPVTWYQVSEADWQSGARRQIESWYRD